jgi:succinate dehydrogenase / fumarate reductase membrane anchor subunit
MSDFRTPMGRVRGLGAAKEGVEHWWAQRLTAIALIPLTLWFVIGVVSHVGASHAAALAWLGQPWNAVLMILFIVAAFHHAQLGMQAVFEDYVHKEWLKLTLIVGTKYLAILVGLAAIMAELWIVFGRAAPAAGG